MPAMKKVLFLIIIITALTTTILTAGCPAPPTTSVSPTTSEIPTTTATSTTTTALGRGVLRLYGVDPYTLDPAIAGDGNSHSYIAQIFSGLVCLDDNMGPEPDIAWKWQVGDDGRTYTFYLRQGVKFQDGREVKAEDFKYSWERACNPDTRSLTAATYLGDIVGAKEMLISRLSPTAITP